MEVGTWQGVVLIISSFHISYARPLDADVEAKINSFAEKLLTCRDIVGMNVAIVQNSETIFTHGYGVIDKDTKHPVTSSTLFGVASLTKAFTATLLGQVLKDKGYSWNSRVRDILGDDFYFYDGLRTSQTTMRDLGSHKLGLPNHNFARFEGLSRHDASYKVRFFEPEKEFRNSFIYNNAMYGLMAYVTEVLSEKSWEETMMDYILGPSKMMSTTFSHVVNQSRDDIALPYDDDFNGNLRLSSLQFHSFWGQSGGSGSVMSTAEDMTSWLKLQLSLGKLDNTQIISQDVIKESHEAFNNIKSEIEYQQPRIPFTYAQTGYGLGWRTGWYRGLPMVFHTGTSWGYGGLLSLLPDVGIGIYSSITGSDSGYVGRRLFHMYIMDLLLGEEPWLNLTTACTFPEPWGPAKSRKTNMSPAPIEFVSTDLYVGRYGNFLYGNITFGVNATTEKLNLYYGDIARWELEALDDHTFRGTGADLIWSVSLSKIQFMELSEGVFQSVSIDFDRSYPTTFYRGLKMSEAPPPPDPTQCDTKNGASNILAFLPFVLQLIIGLNYLKI